MIRSLLTRYSLSLLLPTLSLASTALPSPTITANLPANTAIVNINSAVDGSNGYNSPQSLWYQPFATTGQSTIPAYTVQPGTYTFRVIDPTDAASLYPALNSSQLSQIYTAWTYNSPWITNYLVFDSAAASNSSISQLLYGAPSTQGYGNPTDAYNAAIANHYYNSFYIGIADASNSLSTTYTFSSPQTLLFVVPDNGLYDNTSGVSVLVSAVLPGDANGDGRISADDFALLDRGFAKHLTGWANGDFNADGIINAADYLILDSAYAQQNNKTPEPALLASRESQFGPSYSTSLLSSLPEPTLLLPLILLSLSPRRRRI